MKGPIGYMKGIELSKEFFETYGRPMIKEKFPDYFERIAIGLVGEGSECFGFDDAISCDHDFLPSFCMWLTEEDVCEIGNALQSAYELLPMEFQGCRLECASIGGGKRRGVFSIDEFYRKVIGTSSVPQNWKQWFWLPQYALATAVNGEVFYDGLGTFSTVREALKKGYPRDVKLKKLAAHLALMAQAGQYNIERCVKHGEYEAAHLAIYEFVNHTMEALFLLSGRYAPYYKWRFRALSETDGYFDVYRLLCELFREHPLRQKVQIVDQICNYVLIELKRCGLTASNETYLEAQALEVSKQIRDPEIRSLHLMEYGA